MAQGGHQTAVQVRNAAHLIFFARRYKFNSSEYIRQLHRRTQRWNKLKRERYCAMLNIVVGSGRSPNSGSSAQCCPSHFFRPTRYKFNSCEYIRQLHLRTQRWDKLKKVILCNAEDSGWLREGTKQGFKCAMVPYLTFFARRDINLIRASTYDSCIFAPRGGTS